MYGAFGSFSFNILAEASGRAERIFLQRVSQSGLKAQQFHSPGQAKRRPGFGMRAIGAPCKGKSIRLLYTFALTGRSYICLPPTQGAASLALG